MKYIAMFLALTIFIGVIPSVYAEENTEEVITIEGKSRAKQSPGEKEKPVLQEEAKPYETKVPVAKEEAKSIKPIKAEEYKEEEPKSKGVDFLKNPALYILILFGLIIGGNT